MRAKVRRGIPLWNISLSGAIHLVFGIKNERKTPDENRMIIYDINLNILVTSSFHESSASSSMFIALKRLALSCFIRSST
jgi:hypothetical protein